MFGDELENLAASAIRQNIKSTVRSFVHAANPGVEVRQQALFGDDPFAIQNEAHKRPADQFGNEEIALPCGKKFSGIESDTSGCDVGSPEVHGLFHAGLPCLIAIDGFSRVLVAVADNR